MTAPIAGPNRNPSGLLEAKTPIANPIAGGIVDLRVGHRSTAHEEDRVNDKTWRNASIALAVICILLLGVAGALYFGSNSGGPSATATSPAFGGGPTATPSASVAGGPTGGSSGTASTSGTPGPGASATPKPTPSPKPTQSAATASITFNDMMLNAQSDPAATSRTFSFTSDGPGPVSMLVAKSSLATPSIKMCVQIDAGAQTCSTGAKPGFPNALADRPHSLWVVTLIGVGAATPTVDVAFSWPAVSPSITLAHGRLQGSSSPGISEALNGFNATFKPRGAGSVSVGVAWTAIVTDVDLALADVTGESALSVNEVQKHGVKAVDPPYTHSVDAGKKYKITFRDLAADSQRPDLSATISFP
jgi:hypothetical protein